MDQHTGPRAWGIAVESLAEIDLTGELPDMAGYTLRLRRITMAPGAVFGPVHDHVGRPGTVYVLRGTITDHRDGESREYGPGLGWPEDRRTLHRLENAGSEEAVEISVDLVRRP